MTGSPDELLAKLQAAGRLSMRSGCVPRWSRRSPSAIATRCLQSFPRRTTRGASPTPPWLEKTACRGRRSMT
jgi:hypothetical protein